MLFRGVFPVLPTPFGPDEQIDPEAVERLIAFCAQCRAPGVALPAYGSEFYKLSDQERLSVIGMAVKAASASGLPVIAQCNHTSGKVAAEMAGAAERLGASAIAVAMPRMFPFHTEELFEYVVTVAHGTGLPLLLQDWNPGGLTVDAEFVKRLKAQAPNLEALKLEETGMGPKTRRIQAATDHKVAVLEGWGGLYLMELHPAGIAGIMPGLPLLDLFIRIWELLDAGKQVEAFSLFAPIVPYLLFSLQDMEHFHSVDKRLAQRRGLLLQPIIRSPTKRLDEDSAQYLEFLIDQVLRHLAMHGFPERPLDAV